MVFCLFSSSLTVCLVSHAKPCWQTHALFSACKALQISLCVLGFGTRIYPVLIAQLVLVFSFYSLFSLMIFANTEWSKKVIPRFYFCNNSASVHEMTSWLPSFGSYRKIKTAVSLFWTTRYMVIISDILTNLTTCININNYCILNTIDNLQKKTLNYKHTADLCNSVENLISCQGVG